MDFTTSSEEVRVCSNSDESSSAFAASRRRYRRRSCTRAMALAARYRRWQRRMQSNVATAWRPRRGHTTNRRTREQTRVARDRDRERTGTGIRRGHSLTRNCSHAWCPTESNYLPLSWGSTGSALVEASKYLPRARPQKRARARVLINVNVNVRVRERPGPNVNARTIRTTPTTRPYALFRGFMSRDRSRLQSRSRPVLV